MEIFKLEKKNLMGVGGWGFGVGGLGIGDWGWGPIPNPQSPIPNPHLSYFKKPFFIIYNLDK